MTVYTENPKEYRKKEKSYRLVRESSKIEGFKVNIQKSIAFLCTEMNN